MTTDDARRRAIRAARALHAAELAELDGPALEAFEVQAADAWARYVTITAKPPARATSGPRCAVCHRDAHRPGMSGYGYHGHAYQSPQPTA